MIIRDFDPTAPITLPFLPITPELNSANEALKKTFRDLTFVPASFLPSGRWGTYPPNTVFVIGEAYYGGGFHLADGDRDFIDNQCLEISGILNANCPGKQFRNSNLKIDEDKGILIFERQ